MEIFLENVGKRYRRDWIFRGIDFRFESGKSYAVSGPNGSGKSTFLKILSSHLTPTKGKISFFERSKEHVEPEKIYRSLSYAAPYIELLEEFSLEEMLNFHQKFKTFQKGITPEKIITLTNLENSAKKEIRFFSSGMKQRVKLALAVCVDSPVLLLDEPSTNLDRVGIDWYRDLVRKYSEGRTMIIASNVTEDFDFCDKKLNIIDFKKSKN